MPILMATNNKYGLYFSKNLKHSVAGLNLAIVSFITCYITGSHVHTGSSK